MVMQLYHNNMSVCAQKVRLTLAEKGQTAEEIHLDLRAADQQNPDYLKLNPKGYVPTLIHDSTVVTESTIICEYIDEIFPTPPLKPESAAGRAVMRSWTRRPDERIHDACVTISNCLAFRHQWLSRPADELAETIARTPDRDIRARRVDVIENGTNSPRFKSGILAYDQLFKEMEAALSRSRFLVSDVYSLADIGLIPYVNRIAELKLDCLFSNRPNLGTWFADVTGRQTFKQAVTAYDERNYLDLMAKSGREHHKMIKGILEEAA